MTHHCGIIGVHRSSLPYHPVPEFPPITSGSSVDSASSPLSAALVGGTLEAARAASTTLSDEQLKTRSEAQSALEAKAKAEYKWQPSSISCQTSSIRLCNADFLEFDWADADVLFANSTWLVLTLYLYS
jgi:hypothetical protein